MAWCEFSAEAIELDSKIRRLHAQGRTSAAVDAIKDALKRAALDGPSNTTYEEFEIRLNHKAKEGRA